ncbi:MAG: hypothetical protein AAF492_13450, partial [Verrucomicrobiota bacterium]
LLELLLVGVSVQSACERMRLRFSLEAVYHLLQRLRGRLGEIRRCLIANQAGPPPKSTDPLLQIIEHLKAIGSGEASPIEVFQVRFQAPLMG